MQELTRRFEEHLVTDEKRMAHISDSIDKIKDNHLAHIQTSTGELEKKYASIEADITWLKWGMMLIIGGIVAVYFKQ